MYIHIYIYMCVYIYMYILNTHIIKLNKQIVLFVDPNECESYPCENGGTCTDAVNRYTCKCQNGYTGVSCEIGMSRTNTGMCPSNGYTLLRSCVDRSNLTI